MARLLTGITLVYAGALFWGTHTPDVRIPTFGSRGVPSDKILHVMGYGGLGFLLMLSVKAWRPKASTLLRVVVTLAVVAAIDELTQPLTLRDAEWLDWVADLLGVIMGAGLAAGLAARLSPCEMPAMPST